MGGGADSRIPGLLRSAFAETEGRIVVRTYDFDPETGHRQILGWVRELQPDLLIGESLGSIQALRIPDIPQLYVSPSLGAPRYLYRLAWIPLLPGGAALLHWLWPVKEGDRQRLRFEYAVLRKYKAHWKAAREAAAKPCFRYAFFGKRDHYKKWGIVSVSAWRKMFGDTFQEYDGTHFMEENHVLSLLVPKIREILGEPADGS